MCNYLHKALLVPKDLADVHKSEMKSRRMFKYQASLLWYSLINDDMDAVTLNKLKYNLFYI